MEKLVSLMEANPGIAKGIYGKILAKNRWEKFTVELNSLGPPVRNWDKWVKVILVLLIIRKIFQKYLFK